MIDVSIFPPASLGDVFGSAPDKQIDSRLLGSIYNGFSFRDLLFFAIVLPVVRDGLREKLVRSMSDWPD